MADYDKVSVSHSPGSAEVYGDRRPGENAFKHRLRLLVNRKKVDTILQEGEDSGMKRSLGPFDLAFVGIGAIIGGGIFVLTGVAAAQHSGPAIIISFIIAGVCAGFAAFSYSELSSMVPISGSAYTYTYATMGELLAWVIGWDLILEYMVGAATVAVSWSSYLSAFFKDAFNWTLSTSTTTAPVVWKNGTFLKTGAVLNIPAMIIVVLMTALLVVGVRESATVNGIIVIFKILVVLIFVFGACNKVDPANYQPFIPPEQDGRYGGLGVIKAAKTVFFAYIGFDVVSTAAQEAKNPKRDLPIGIITSLVICTALYIATATVVVGLRPYYELDVAHPISFALETFSNTRWLRIIVDLGAVLGLMSVILVMIMGQSRVFHTMANDGLFPGILARLHPRFKTPYIPTIIVGACCAMLAGFLPVDLLGDMTSVGTLLAFFLVHAGVIILRFTHPDVPRGFRVPLGPFVFPVLGGIISIALIAMSDVDTIYRLFIWLGVGLVIYAFYGHRKSRLNFPRPEDQEVVSYTRAEKDDVDNGTEGVSQTDTPYSPTTTMPMPVPTLHHA
ncbi:hypothetical protein IWQ62_000096 [Dispira parvispora]|uniref:Amino acid permease n=1 Tax=Dispira parvispora TaxID=1520584 RepID=A0A9W8AZ19_9FUNG|nr:hypothetical protein IWQ62_000096 [Dispira parvispora]